MCQTTRKKYIVIFQGFVLFVSFLKMYVIVVYFIIPKKSFLLNFTSVIVYSFLKENARYFTTAGPTKCKSTPDAAASIILLNQV